MDVNDFFTKAADTACFGPSEKWGAMVGDNGPLRRISAIAAALCVTILAAGAMAGEDGDRVIELATGNDYKPLADENLPHGGMTGEIVSEIYRSLGAETVFHFLPWNRSYELAARGDYLATFPFLKTERRQRDFIYSDPIYSVSSKAMVMSHANWSDEQLRNLEGLSYCRPLGYTIDMMETVRDLTEAGRMSRHTPTDMAKCMEMLALERVDFVLINEPQGISSAREAFGSADRVKFLDIDLPHKGLHVLFSRSRPEAEDAVRRFNEALAALKDSGRYDEIVARHLD